MYLSILYLAIMYLAILYSAIFYSVILYLAILSSAILYSAILYLAILDFGHAGQSYTVFYFQISGKSDLIWLKYGYLKKIQDGCQKSKMVVWNPKWVSDIY